MSTQVRAHIAAAAEAAARKKSTYRAPSSDPFLKGLIRNGTEETGRDVNQSIAYTGGNSGSDLVSDSGRKVTEVTPPSEMFSGQQTNHHEEYSMKSGHPLSHEIKLGGKTK